MQTLSCSIGMVTFSALGSRGRKCGTSLVDNSKSFDGVKVMINYSDYDIAVSKSQFSLRYV